MNRIAYKKVPPSSDLARKARLLALAGDETRIRILCFLFRYEEACVTNIADGVGVSVNTASHHLRMMKDVGVLASERTGTTICYKLVRDEFVNNLERAICDR